MSLLTPPMPHSLPHSHSPPRPQLHRRLTPRLTDSLPLSPQQFSNIQAAKGELGKTREQLAEEKKIALSIRVKPLCVDGVGASALRQKAEEMWNLIIKLETEKYDMEERMKRQDYDVSGGGGEGGL